jgi:hypothetical protein
MSSVTFGVRVKNVTTPYISIQVLYKEQSSEELGNQISKSKFTCILIFLLTWLIIISKIVKEKQAHIFTHPVHQDNTVYY